MKDASTIRPRLMQALAKQYQETYYGELAANDGKAVRPKSIRAWKDFTEAEIQAAVSKQKKLFEEISSTIPIALKRASAQGKLKPGDVVMIVGFGVGYSWASALVRWVSSEA